MEYTKLDNIQFPRTKKDRKGNIIPIKTMWENTKYLLDRLGITVRLNLLTKDIEIRGKGFSERSLDTAVVEIRGLLDLNGLTLSKNDTWDMIGRIAEENQYSPVRDYLRQCRKDWDGQDHIAELFKLFELDEEMKQNPAFCQKLLRKWLLSCVRVAFNNGDYAAQGLLILVGAQGIGKTRFLYTLLPCKEWGTDGVTLNPAVKDDVLKVMRFWLVELGELGETMKRERLDRLKQFFTQSTDVLRKPYAQSTQSYPRNTAFIGSVNGSGFLKDTTGDRRYWVIAVSKVHNDTDIDINQVWGQLTYLAMEEQEPAYLDSEDIAILEKANQQYKYISAEEQVLLDMLDWDAPIEDWREMTATQICETLSINRSYIRRLGRALTSLAGKDKRIKAPRNHMRGRKYLVPPVKNDMPTYGSMGL